MDIPSRQLQFRRLPESEMRLQAEAFYQRMRSRRSVRHFSDEPVPMEVLRHCIAAAATAPSGAHKQPWTFVVVTDAATKQLIRDAAEKEEQAFYGGRAPERWLNDLAHLGTNAHKPYLSTVPALIAVFAQRYGAEADHRNYYVSESVGIAVGMLLCALHQAGLATLTHTPSPMGFLSKVLRRPANERAYVLLPVGYPSEDCAVPDLQRKVLSEVMVEYDPTSSDSK